MYGHKAVVTLTISTAGFTALVLPLRPINYAYPLVYCSMYVLRLSYACPVSVLRLTCVCPMPDLCLSYA